MKKPQNPFVLAGYFGKPYFCDRVEELATINGHLDNDRNLVIFSWRRLGKTALIKYLLGSLNEAGNSETLYIDLLGTRNINEAIKQITEAVYEKFGKTSAGFSATFQKLLGSLGVDLSFDPVSGMPTFSFGLKSAKVVGQALNSIGEFLSTQKKRVIIALDEFQQINQYVNENGEAVFRSWMQSFPNIRFIFSGSHRNMMASMFTERKRPFYRSAQLLQLDPIELPVYKKFISNHFKKNKKTISDECIEEIYRWSRHQTYCVQLVCNKLFGMYDTVNLQKIETVCKEIIEQESSVFGNYVNLLTYTNWQVLRSIAKAEPLRNPFSKEFLMRYQLGAVSTVGSALKTLQKKELVIKDGKEFYVHDVILARWLQTL